jgi:hypothetical protein
MNNLVILFYQEFEKELKGSMFLLYETLRRAVKKLKIIYFNKTENNTFS